MPPWLWASPLGSPVVPDVNSTHSGWENSTCSNSSGASSASISSHDTAPVRVWTVERVGDVDELTHRRKVRAQLRDDLAAVDVLAVPVVAVDRDQDGGLELREPADGALGAEVRRAARPHRADRRSGQAADHRVLGVRQVGADPVAGPHPARRSHPAAAATDRRREPYVISRAGRPPSWTHSSATASSSPLRSACCAQFSRAPGEPAGVRHRVGGAHLRPRRGELDLVVVDQGDPEPVHVLDRPRPEGVVVGERPALTRLEPVQVRAQRGVLDPRRRRAPKRVGHA